MIEPTPKVGAARFEPVWKRVGLRARVIGLVVLVLIPIVGFQVYESISRYEARTRLELQSSLELAEATGTAFLNYLDNLWNTELALGSAVALDDSPLPSQKAKLLMEEFLTARSEVQTISWVNPQGVVTASTRPEAVGMSVADREYVRRIVAGENAVVSDLLTGRVTQNAVLAVARGIRTRGRLDGIMIILIPAQDIGKALPLRHRHERIVGLSDHNGIIAFRSKTPVLQWQNRITRKDSPVRQALRTGKAVLSRRYVGSADGVPCVGAFVPIGQIGWVATAAAPIDAVLAQPRAEAIRDILVLCLIAAFSLWVATLLGAGFLRRIYALQAAAQGMSGGNLSARVNITGDDELAMAGRAFDLMASRVEDLEAQRTRFLQTAAHELRNPMAAVKGICSLLRLECEPEDSESATLIKTMEREVDRLSDLLNEMLQAFIAQEGRLTLKKEPVNLVDVVTSALTPFVSMDRQHHFVVQESEPAVYVIGDYKRLEEVVRNLVSNAVKYSPAGGEVELAVRVSDGEALVSVEDRGVGIPQGQLSAIFEAFTRGNNLAGHDPGGIGLGLYICKDIVNQHDGRIWAESEENAGTTFYVALPLCPTAS